MGVQAKKESIIRMTGLIFILLSFLISIVIDILILNDPIFILLYFLALIPWILLVIFLKLELDFVIEKQKLFLFIAIVYSPLIIIIGLIYGVSQIAGIRFVFIIISIVTLLMGWHFTLSLYRKEKLVFFVGILCYLILSILFRFLYGIFLSLLPFILSLIGLVLVFGIEYIMKKKGLLNYI